MDGRIQWIVFKAKENHHGASQIRSHLRSILDARTRFRLRAGLRKVTTVIGDVHSRILIPTAQRSRITDSGSTVGDRQALHTLAEGSHETARTSVDAAPAGIEPGRAAVALQSRVGGLREHERTRTQAHGQQGEEFRAHTAILARRSSVPVCTTFLPWRQGNRVEWCRCAS